MQPVDPVTARQPNPGQFQNPQGNNPGAGSALLNLLRMRASRSQGPNMVAGPQNPGGIQMSQPPQGVGGPPRIMGAPPSGDIAGAGMPQMPSGMSPNAPQGASMAQPVQTPTTPDDNLQLAMSALAGYIKSHGDILRAKHGVDLQKARASQIAAQGQPQGGQ